MSDSRTHTPTLIETERILRELSFLGQMDDYSDIVSTADDAMAAIKALRASHDGLVEALRQANAMLTYPVSSSINPREWDLRPEQDIEYAVGIIRRALEAAGIKEAGK